jgi:hypothetical protein
MNNERDDLLSHSPLLLASKTNVFSKFRGRFLYKHY